MIKVKDLFFKFKEGNIGLNKINLEFKRGEITIIVGSNGSGKSTLLSSLANLNKYNGLITLDDVDIKKISNRDLRKKVGIVFQNPNNQVILNKVYDDIKFTLENLELNDIDKRIKKSLDLVNMSDYINRDSYNLSLGEKQRIALSSVLASNPEFLLLDEVTSMVDYNGKQSIYKLIQELKKNNVGIIMTTNIIDELIYADKIIIINNKHEIENVISKEEMFNDLSCLNNFYLPLKFQIISKIGYKNFKNLSDEEIMKYVS